MMGMTASIVTYSVDPANAEELHKQVQEHLLPAARQCAGYRAFLLIDQGDGKRLGLLLFDSAEDARAAQGTLTPVGRDYTYALMNGPAIGALGAVIFEDGICPN